jgi:hypothetical protein
MIAAIGMLSSRPYRDQAVPFRGFHGTEKVTGIEGHFAILPNEFSGRGVYVCVLKNQQVDLGRLGRIGLDSETKLPHAGRDPNQYRHR